ncbi:MAG: hypothetical protein HZB26_15250 [Candidatus Hydrogenedentes bacterium]|nr:hypothetical protein [Candidatus Hydrogenedentota bacterium]
MSTFLKFGGWIVAVIAIVVAVALGLKLREAQQQRDTAHQWKATLENQIEDLNKLQVLAKAKTDDIEKKLDEATKTVEKLKAEPGKASADALASKDPAAALKALFKGAAPGEEGKADEGNPFKGLGEMFKGEKGKALAKMSVDMQVNAMYGPFFKDLNLPADVEEQARGIVSKNLEAQMQAGLKMMSGEKVDTEQMGKESQNAQKQIRDELSKVLSADELAKYDQYQEDMPRHTLEQSYDMQLSMSGSSMKQESRDLIKQTLVEETLASVPDFGKPGSSTEKNPASAFDAQLAAIDRSRERLRTQLDEEQYALAERFLNQQQTQAQTMRDMMSTMFSGNKKPEAPKPK